MNQMNLQPSEWIYHQMLFVNFFAFLYFFFERDWPTNCVANGLTDSVRIDAYGWLVILQ